MSLNNRCSCGSNCFELFNIKSVKSLRYQYWSKSRYARSQWLIQTLKVATQNGKYKMLSMDSGETVCMKAFKKLLNINKNMVVKCSSGLSRNSIALPPRSERTKSVAVVSSINWLEDYFSFYSDRMPDSKAVLLPYKMTKASIYQTYVRDMEERRQQGPVSIPTFYQIWSQHFPDVKIKQVGMCLQNTLKKMV